MRVYYYYYYKLTITTTINISSKTYHGIPLYYSFYYNDK